MSGITRIGAVCAIVIATRCAGQSFNVDFGTVCGTVSATYGGAASQPGFWNEFPDAEEPSIPLLDLAGRGTAVTINQSLPFGQACFNHPGTRGDVGGLLDDYLDLHSTPHTFVIEGLAAGLYHITTYAWAPDLPTAKTTVMVNDNDPQIIGGAWPGGLVPGITFATHDAVIREGEALNIFTFGFFKGTLNGLQVTMVGTVPDTDLNDDGVVNGADLGLLLSAWGEGKSPADFNLDGTVDGADLGILLAEWTI